MISPRAGKGDDGDTHPHACTHHLLRLCRSKNACKRAVVDFRGAHEKILDAIRERTKLYGANEARSALPNLDVTTLFPPRDDAAQTVHHPHRKISSSFTYFVWSHSLRRGQRVVLALK